MGVSSPLLLVLFLLAILVIVLAPKLRGNIKMFPPHEFAYGAALQDSNEIAQRIDDFLSLPALDPAQTQIQTYVGAQSANNLTPLINYISSQESQDLAALVPALQNIDSFADQKQKAIQLVKALLPYKESLNDESQQDSVIVFVHYGLKQPSELSQEARAKIAALVRQLDTPAQAEKFDSGKCPDNYLKGNLNVYPLALDNTMWHNNAEFQSEKTTPILEIRFMGLKGIFKYLLDEVAAKTQLHFVHLDGNSLDP